MISMLWMGLLACVKYGPVQVMHSDLDMKLTIAEQDPWTKECAPNKIRMEIKSLMTKISVVRLLKIMMTFKMRMVVQSMTMTKMVW